MPSLKISRLTALLAAAVIGAVLWSACGGEPAAQQQEEQAEQPAVQQSAAQAQQQQQTAPAADESELPPLKLGLLLDMSGDLGEFGVEMRRGFELAVQHINDAGGIFGRPVEVVIADTGLDPTIGVEEARRMIEVEGVHAVVGALSSAVSLPIAESVAGLLQVPFITPSAQTTQLSIAQDNDFLFRTTASSEPEAHVIAQLMLELDYENVGVIVRNDAWGQSFARVWQEAFEGQSVEVFADPRQPSFVSELQQTATDGGAVLLLMAFAPESEIMVREALELGIYDTFVLTAGNESLDLIRAVTPHLQGMYGAATTTDPNVGHAPRWDEAFIAHFGELPKQPYVRETYDATIALALAAQSAMSVDGAAIRDHLRLVGESSGEIVTATPEGVARGLELLRAGQSINIEGISSNLNWDENGDLRQTFVSVWQVTEEDLIEDLGVVLVEGVVVQPLSEVFSVD